MYRWIFRVAIIICFSFMIVLFLIWKRWAYRTWFPFCWLALFSTVLVIVWQYCVHRNWINLVSKTMSALESRVKEACVYVLHAYPVWISVLPIIFRRTLRLNRREMLKLGVQEISESVLTRGEKKLRYLTSHLRIAGSDWWNNSCKTIVTNFFFRAAIWNGINVMQWMEVIVIIFIFLCLKRHIFAFPCQLKFNRDRSCNFTIRFPIKSCCNYFNNLSKYFAIILLYCNQYVCCSLLPIVNSATVILFLTTWKT